MNYSQIRAILRKKTGVMILAGLLLAAVVFWGMMLFSPKYQSNLDLLIVQNQEGFVDSYTLAKSTEYFSKLLTESVYTEAFLGKVVEGYPDLAKILPVDRENKMKKWSNTVKTSLNTELGILHVKVLVNDKSQAENISRAVASALGANSNLFTSESQKIEVRMVNAPIVKSNPGAGMLGAVTLASFLAGALLVFAVSFYASVLDQGKSGDDGMKPENIWMPGVVKDNEGNEVDAGTGEIMG